MILNYIIKKTLFAKNKNNNKSEIATAVDFDDKSNKFSVNPNKSLGNPHKFQVPSILFSLCKHHFHDNS